MKKLLASVVAALSIGGLATAAEVATDAAPTASAASCYETKYAWYQAGRAYCNGYPAQRHRAKITCKWQGPGGWVYQTKYGSWSVDGSVGGAGSIAWCSSGWTYSWGTWQLD